MYASVGEVSTLTIPAVWNQAILGLTARSQRADSRFIAYWLRHFAPIAISQANVATQANLGADQVMNFPFPDLDVNQQRRIADFLDDRIALIDQIIAERQRHSTLVDDLLAAQRARQFENAEAQEWPQVRLAALCSFFSDGDWIESPYITDEGIRLIQTGNIGVGTYREQGFRYISEETFDELRCTAVIPGDVLISRLAGPVARACLCPDMGRMIASVDVTIARPTTALDPEYLVQFLSSPKHLADATEAARGSTMQRVSRSQLGSFRIPVAPLDRQRAIASELYQCARDADQLRTSLDKSCTLLEEYKQSLITAAVTGELDVTTASTTIPE